MNIELIREYANLGFPFVLLLFCAYGVRQLWASVWPRVVTEREYQEERSRTREKRTTDQLDKFSTLAADHTLQSEAFLNTSSKFLSTLDTFQNGMSASLRKIVDVLIDMQATQAADKRDIMDAIKNSERNKNA